jgi:hypothetical protein
MELVLYGRAECGLCDEMLDEILALAEPRLRIRRVDVDSDPALVRRFGADVPVLCLDDEVLCRHVLDAERLARVLSAAR